MAQKTDNNSPTSQWRRFVLIRVEDLTSISGTGEVAEGTGISSGLAVIHWLWEPHAVGVFQTLEKVIAVYGNKGRTQLQFID